MPVHTRESALEVAESMLLAAPRWTDTRFRKGYFEGLVGGWCQCGIISEDEMTQLRARMRGVRPVWWNLSGLLGL